MSRFAEKAVIAFTLGSVALSVVLPLAVFGAVVYVAVHFLAKVW